ncbi:MAG: hypothetical protein AAF903_14810 [Pseudomonadota bacterium]
MHCSNPTPRTGFARPSTHIPGAYAVTGTGTVSTLPHSTYLAKPDSGSEINPLKAEQTRERAKRMDDKAGACLIMASAMADILQQAYTAFGSATERHLKEAGFTALEVETHGQRAREYTQRRLDRAASQGEGA